MALVFWWAFYLDSYRRLCADLHSCQSLNRKQICKDGLIFRKSPLCLQELASILNFHHTSENKLFFSHLTLKSLDDPFVICEHSFGKLRSCLHVSCCLENTFHAKNNGSLLFKLNQLVKNSPLILVSLWTCTLFFMQPLIPTLEMSYSLEVLYICFGI